MRGAVRRSNAEPLCQVTEVFCESRRTLPCQIARPPASRRLILKVLGDVVRLVRESDVIHRCGVPSPIRPSRPAAGCSGLTNALHHAGPGNAHLDTRTSGHPETQGC